MTVTFTTNIALAKPDGTEIAENWVNNIELIEDNNLIIIDKMDVNLTTYSPTLTAHTTAPNKGTGNTDGEYCDVQGFVFGNFIVEFFDAGITVGSGEYGVSLPFPVDATYHSVGTALNDAMGAFSVIGEGSIWDNSSVGNSGSVALDVVTVGGVSYVRLCLETFAGKTSPVFRDSMPFAVANNDKFTGQFFYKRA